MNVFSRVFCRTVQFFFRLAMPVLPYRQLRLLTAVEDLAGELEKAGISSVLLVTDSFLKTSGATLGLEQSLLMAGIRCAVYDRVRPNPTVRNVEEALESYHAQDCRGLIAFGGGPVFSGGGGSSGV